jgi:membrane fusion protein (multidrug efflux system)
MTGPADTRDRPDADGGTDPDRPAASTGSGAGWRRAAAVVGLLALVGAAVVLAWRLDLFAGPGVVVARDAHLRGEVVEIGAGVDARVTRLHAEAGARVAAGEVLVELEDAALRADVASAEAALDLARARKATAERALVRDRRLRRLAVEAARSELDQAQAARRAAAAVAERRRAAFDRVAALYDDGVASEARRDRVLANRDAAEADLREQRAEVAAAQAALSEAEAREAALDVRELEIAELGHRIAAARAALDRARADLDEATLTAPLAGWIVDTPARPGDSVRPGDPIVTLWPETAIRVRAWVSEEDATRIRPGQPARVTFDAFPGRPVIGAVEAVTIAADGGPQRPPGTPASPLLPDRTRFAVRILLGDGPPDRRLLPGLSATVRIGTAGEALPGRGLGGPSLERRADTPRDAPQ